MSEICQFALVKVLGLIDEFGNVGGKLGIRKLGWMMRLGHGLVEMYRKAIPVRYRSDRK